MNLPPEPVPPVHEVALLLPWYLNGQLGEAERLEVERHLAACDACCEELTALQSLRANYRELQLAEPGPSPSVRAALFAQLPPALSPSPTRRTRNARWLDALSGIFRPAWVQVAVSLLVITQFAVLGSMLYRTPGEVVTSRAVARPTTRLRIVFVGTATQEQEVAVLRGIGGRVVDGPDAGGAYLIELAPQPPAALAQRLKALREQTDVVRNLELVPP